LTLVPQERKSLDRYEADEHDIGPIQSDLIQQARQQRANEYGNAPTAVTTAIAFDATRPPFDDVRVRQAFVHAVDRKTLYEVVWAGLLIRVAMGGYVPPGMPGHSPDIGLTYDPERARGLLAEAGYPQGHGFPPIEAWTVPMHHVSLRYIETQWRENLGIEVAWQKLDFSDARQRLMTHSPHLFLNGWTADYPDPDTFLRVGLHFNGSHWHNAQYEQLLAAAQRVIDPAERLRFYQAADRLLIREAGIMPLVYNQQHWLIKPWVKRYPLSPFYVMPWKDVIIEPH
jgi:oligopeptide transport system substrate-binding protein